MFYSGDVQSGIALSLQESKSVVCFVHDAGEESLQWEQTWMQDQNIPQALERRAITLRLEAGSQDAGLLAAFCPVDKVPSIVIINQGRLIDHLSAGIGKNDFTIRLLRAISPDARPQVPSTQSTISSQNQSSSAAPTQPNPSQTSTSPPSEQLTALYEERRTRLEAERKAQEDAEKAKRKARRENDAADASTSAGDAAASTARQSYLQQQAQRKREAKADKERVQQLIENDKIARQEKKERELQARRTLQTDDSSSTELSSSAPTASLTRTESFRGDSASIQVRLFDGSTIRNIFPKEAQVNTIIRPWIDSERQDGFSPYILKQILTPLPSRLVKEADEGKTIEELGLLPNATLALVPPRRVAAVATGGPTGFFGAVYSYIASWFGLIAEIYTHLIAAPARQRNAADQGSGESVQNETNNETQASRASGISTGSSQSGIKIRTLQSQRQDENEDQQLYNGNQLNFEPNQEKDNDGEKEE